MHLTPTLPLTVAVFAAMALVGVSAAPMMESDAAANVSESGVALDGHSPVAYFTQGRAVRGSARFAAEHDGVTYHLASADERRMFEADPCRYVPAYGGWCAYGLTLNERFPVDPTRFKIVDGRLLLFLNSEEADALALWNDRDERQQLNAADANWQTMNH